jgi:hypothetical protein
MTQQVLLLFMQKTVNARIKGINFCVLSFGNLLLFDLKLFTLFSVLIYLAFGNFAPFLEEFNVVFLSFLLDHFVVGIHFTHQFDMSIVHVLHVFFDFFNVGLCKLKRYQMGWVRFFFGIVAIVLIVSVVLKLIEGGFLGNL